MGKLVRLSTGSDIESVEEFKAQLLSGEVTHGCMIYRTSDDRICYRTFKDSDKYGVYMVGIVEVVKAEWLAQRRGGG